MANLNDLDEFGAIGVVSSCLILGPGMIKAEQYCLLGCMARQRRCDSPLVSLHVRSMLLASPVLPTSKSGLALRR